MILAFEQICSIEDCEIEGKSDDGGGKGNECSN